MAYTTIDDPSEYFQTLLYTGNATDNRNLTNSANAGDFQPDWLWLKERSSTSSHQLHDSNRGTSKALLSDTTAAEDTDANRVQAFQTNGFQVGTASTVNQNTITMVAWQWKANGGTTANNTDGNLTTVVQANQDAGFSIVLWTSTGSSDTIGHGLGATPTVIIEKSRSGSSAWTFFTSVGGAKLLSLNTTDAAATSFSGVSNVGSSIFTDGNGGTDTRVAYCFTPIQGYSKFGIYEGNGNANGTFVHLGFKPAWFMCKSIDTADSDQGWNIFDTKRDGYNVDNDQLLANDSGAEVTTDRLDIVSNGVKMRNAGSQTNSAQTYFYMAFAENPFVSSKGVPTTAR